MNILITGGCGFIGSFFCEELFKRHKFDKMVILDDVYDCASEKNILSLMGDNRVLFVKGNLQDKKILNTLFNVYKFKWVAHLAAQTHVDNSFHTPLQFTLDNVLGTHTLLEVVREKGTVERFLHVSTDEVYGSTSDEKPNTVESLLEPSNPYAATKAAAEMLVKSYIQSFNLNAFIVRMNNVYGPRQFPEKMIPRFLQNLKEGKALEIHGTGQQKRSLLYVTDAAKALVLVLEKGEQNKIYNVPSKDEKTVLEVAKLLTGMTGLKENIEYVQDRPFNDRRYWIHDEVLEGLGWKQEVSLEEGLRKTISWYWDENRAEYWSKKS